MINIDQLAQRVRDHFVGLSEPGARSIASDYAYSYFHGPDEGGQMPETYTEEDVQGILMTIAMSGLPEKEPDLALNHEEQARKIVTDCEAEIIAARERRNEKLRALYNDSKFTKASLSRASGLDRGTIHTIIGPGPKPGTGKRKAARK